jgi:hypothetical protein
LTSLLPAVAAVCHRCCWCCCCRHFRDIVAAAVPAVDTFSAVVLSMALLQLLLSVAIAAVPAIAAIFSFDAIFHQFTHLFALHTLSQTIKMFHATIHEQ